VALIVVLLFILLLSAIVVEYAYETQVEASLVGNNLGDFQAYVAAKSGVASGLALLQADLLASDLLGGTGQQNAGARRSFLSGKASQSQAGAEEDYDSLQDIWAQGVPFQQINEAVMQCSIADECGKLNLNALFVNENEVNPVFETALHNLFQALQVEEDPTDAILDWLDPDDEPRPEGAESDYYAGLETPYACKNGLMDSIEELLLIRGITPELFFNANVYLEGQSMDKRDTEGWEPLGLSDLFSVHGDPRGCINVNTARPELLDALLSASEAGNPGTVDAILQARMEDPFRSVEDFRQRVGISKPKPAQQKPTQNVKPKQKGATQDKNSKPGGKDTAKDDGKPKPGQGQGASQGEIFDVKSMMFRIYGDGRAKDVMVRIEAYVYRMGLSAQSGGSAQGGTDSKNPPKTSKPDNSRKGSGSFLAADTPLESFRILDWRVIR
jgi:general secretion pathway protein K